MSLCDFVVACCIIFPCDFLMIYTYIFFEPFAVPFSYEICFWNSICFLLHNFLVRCHEISLWGFMLFLRWLWMNSVSICCLTLMRLDALCCRFVVWDFLTRFSCFLWAVVRFPYEMSCFRVNNFRVRVPHESSSFLVHNLLMRCHAFWGGHEMCLCDFMLFGPLWDFNIFSYKFSCFLMPMRFPFAISCFLVA